MATHLFFRCVFVLAAAAASDVLPEQLPPPCESAIYCHGSLLHTVQMARLFQDSKTFVDKKLRFHPDLVLLQFERLMNVTSGLPSDADLAQFVEDCFESEGSEFEDWYPSDWTDDPAFLEKIRDAKLRQWGRELHDAWKYLGRKIKDDVRDHPELYSMIYVPNPFVVPGGRFREFYYWDSYWIIQGLLISEMKDTVKGMIENFLNLVDTIGLVPNGGRIYYEQRSQPPLLTAMMERYVYATGDVDFLRRNIHLLEKEMQFWLANRTVTVDGHTLARFNVESDGPRPESYREDYETAHGMSDAERRNLYANLKSGAESGWDFSSRWYIVDNGSVAGDLTHLRTRHIVPVDLNAFLCMNARLLSNMFTLVGDQSRAQLYGRVFLDWKEAIHKVLWNDEKGAWFDYDLINQVQRPYFYASNLAPLWANVWDADSTNIEAIVDRILAYLDHSHATKFCGGLPTSMRDSGQQWDFPNGWPPLQQLIIVGLENTGDERARRLAFDLAQKWIANNYDAYQDAVPSAMFEKYDVTVSGLPGGGGEYDVQLGFGWTNGVVLELLTTYGDRLTSQPSGIDCSGWPDSVSGEAAAFLANWIG